MLRMLDLCAQKRYLNIRKIFEMGDSGFNVDMFRIYNIWLLTLATMDASQDVCSHTMLEEQIHAFP